MPGVARVLGKTGLAIGLGLVLMGPTVQAADAILPAPGQTAAGHLVETSKTSAKKPQPKSKSKSKSKHRQRPGAARQVQVGADLKPGTYTAPIVNRPAKTRRTAKTHQAPKTRPKKHAKPPVKKPARKPPTRSRMNPVVHRRSRPSLAGTWSLFGGEFKFSRIGVSTISDAVITQRVGVFCPAVNDQDGQFVLRQTDKLDYTGTWEWFDPKTCKSAGYGMVKIVVWRTKDTATFTAYPPAGQSGPPDTTMMTRLP